MLKLFKCSVFCTDHQNMRNITEQNKSQKLEAIFINIAPKEKIAKEKRR